MKSVYANVPPPVCKICGEIIRQKPGQLDWDYYRKKTCQMDTKLKPCALRRPKQETVTYSPAAKTERNKKPEDIKNLPKKKVMTQAQADRLDFEQMKINIAIHKKDAERCGYVVDKGRSLSPEEIAQIRVTPIHLIRSGVMSLQKYN